MSVHQVRLDALEPEVNAIEPRFDAADTLIEASQPHFYALQTISQRTVALGDDAHLVTYLLEQYLKPRLVLVAHESAC